MRFKNKPHFKISITFSISELDKCFGTNGLIASGPFCKLFLKSVADILSNFASTANSSGSLIVTGNPCFSRHTYQYT